VARNVTVYVAYDNRATSLPDWMADWEDSGEVIATTDFGREVYSRDFGPGSITLGGNMASGAAGAQSNYSVLVMEREPDPVPPVASFTATPLSGDAPLVVGLDASGSSDADGSIVSWDWDLGNGNSGSGETASYTFNTPGTYTVTLTVTDNDGDTDTAQKTISVSEMPLEDMLIAIGDASVEEGLTVEVPVLLDMVTQTVAGFEFDFELGGDANARITGVEFPDFGLTSYDIISDSRAHVMVLDLNGILQAGEQDIQIVTISVQGISEGSTSMSLGSAQLYDPAGNSIQIDLLGGALNVLASSSGFPLLP
jgi:PKD repeat protein